MKWHIAFWYFVAAAAAAAPIPLIKRYTEDGHWTWIGLSAVSYATLILAYTFVLRAEDIAIVYPFLKVLSVLFVVMTGLVLFRSHLTLRSATGVGLGAAAIYLLSEAR